jgi:hypothetical protein
MRRSDEQALDTPPPPAPSLLIMLDLLTHLIYIKLVPFIKLDLLAKPV